jgi:hypothetical protein
MRSEDYDTVWNVTSPANIGAALKKRHGAERDAFSLIHGKNIRDYLAHAQDNDLTFILHARPDTIYSGPLRQLIDSGQITLRHISRPAK